MPWVKPGPIYINSRSECLRPPPFPPSKILNFKPTQFHTIWAFQDSNVASLCLYCSFDREIEKKNEERYAEEQQKAIIMKIQFNFKACGQKRRS